MTNIHPSEITPQHIYMSRRKFMRGIGALLTSSLLLNGCGQPPPTPTPTQPETPTPPPPSPLPAATAAATPDAAEAPLASGSSDELGAPLTPYAAVIGFNNFYEFTTSKQGVARLAQDFVTSPWTVEVGGLVHRPRTFDLDDLRKFGQEERIYRMRCVEGWSMVIPWLGFPLASLLKAVEPTSQAQYVRLETLYDPEQMPGQNSQTYTWPYVEGLRLDEAMHDLTILSSGLYGQDLLPQSGAPLRLVVPWKYGFKSVKSIVRIDLVEEMPVSLWMAAAPQEYGFYANVNPEVDHPRWSQATELRLGEDQRRDTLMFNGYAEEVADLYAGLDLTQWY